MVLVLTGGPLSFTVVVCGCCGMLRRGTIAFGVAAVGVAPKVDKVTQMLKAKAARKKKQQVPAPARVD